MKRFKKWFCVIIAIVVIISLFAITSSAQDDFVAYIGSKGYTTLENAITDANSSSNDTIKLVKNEKVTKDNFYYSITSNMTIDLCGFTLNVSNQGFDVTQSGVAFTVKNGKLISDYISTQSRFLFKNSKSSSTLTVKDMVVDHNAMVPDARGAFYSSSGGGEIIVDNVTYNYISDYASVGAVISSETTVGVTIKNSVFNCNYQIPAFYTNATGTIKIYNALFNEIDSIQHVCYNSKKTDISQFSATNSTLTFNEYRSGFYYSCTHSFNNGSCQHCGSTVSMYGDANNDSEVNIDDILIAKKHLANSDDIINVANIDFNKNNKADLKDVLRIQKYLLDSIDELDPYKDVNTTDGSEHIKIIHFAYNTPSYGGGTTKDTACLMLPKGYTSNGAPTRLVIDVHGYSIAINEKSIKLGKSPTVDSFLHNGFAVLQVQGLSIGHCGGIFACQSHENAYDYVIEKFNLKDDGVYVNGSSMGGITSINLVCGVSKSESIPVLAQTLLYPITSIYRQTYTAGWIDGLRSSVARYANFSFDKYNEDNETEYTLNSFPFTNPKSSATDAELELFKNNFFNKIACDYSVFGYSNIIADDGVSFAEGFENFLDCECDTELEADSTSEIYQMYEKIQIDYPVPLFVTQCLNDTNKNVWAQKFVRAVNRGYENESGSPVSYEWFEGTKHGGSIGTEYTYTAKDGTVIDGLKSEYTLPKFFLDFEETLNQ